MAARKKQRLPRVAVIGVGVVGGYYAGLLARTGHNVFALARGANLAALQRRGLVVRTPDEEWSSPITASDTRGGRTACSRLNQFSSPDNPAEPPFRPPGRSLYRGCGA
jgi:glutamate dehydrogenase/leucine dehydrogenase